MNFPFNTKHLLYITFVLSLAACSNLPSDKNNSDNLPSKLLQPDAKMVVGDKNAQHELAIYFSPGCPHCLKLFKEVFETIEKDYINTNTLRVAFYEVPNVVGHNQGSYEDAVTDSYTLATDMRCNGIYKGADAYVDRLKHLVDTIDTTFGNQAYAQWPPIGESRQQVFTLLNQKNSLSQEQIASCQTEPLAESIAAVAKSHYSQLFNELGARGLPTYYLDGESVPINSRNSREVLLNALQAAVNK